MSRNKFRAWQHSTKSMRDVLVIDYLNNTVDLSGGEIEQFFEDVELMQYTGLKDKNGIEIYEGDIVCVGWSDYSGELNWSKIKIKNPFDYNMNEVAYINYADELEILGNIYENPELLEV